MCGILGCWGDGDFRLRRALEAMMPCLEHRGPDDSGLWFDENTGLGVANLRLAIRDPTPAGHQPMISSCGRFVLVYNGEIYNQGELRGQLEEEGGSVGWRGHSDTETLLASIKHWGIESALPKLNGMYAFAVWDRTEKTLSLARDRLGIKPLYYGRNSGSFLFGSELKPLRAYPQWQGEVDRRALSLYFRHGYIPAPWTIYQGIKKLPPAHHVTINEKGKTIHGPTCYWDLHQIAQSARMGGSASSIVEQLEELIRDAVGRRMVADVPLGAFLSGGIDSTTVVAMMQAQSESPVRTFTIGFENPSFDEASHARAISDHLGTAHTELSVTSEEARAVIPKLPQIWDEPFADSSQIPTYLVSQLARRQVTVSLSGDGGDELFGGYNRYAVGHRLRKLIRWWPFSIRKMIGMGLKNLPVSQVESVFQKIPGSEKYPAVSDRLTKFADGFSARNEKEFYRNVVSTWRDPSRLVRNGEEPKTLLAEKERWPALDDLREFMMYMDTLTYLPGDILSKTDRASMSVGLEARVPFLDHRLVEFAWKVPTSIKYRDGKGRWPVRQILHRYVPEELMDRPKRGFSVPVGRWLRGPLREWAEKLLNEQRLREEGFLEPAPIREIWRQHLSGSKNLGGNLWTVLMFQSWLESS
ncbi:asparagine synthase (glutamine-hydrolyzing) [Salinibacter sp.]|uniref:asparagine synthase (glutamine-hydrolyzing) n=1 Tax=Salinibacter sp. TaxID=2065818 RepID=UPI0021E98346|nr:asparagine synthase (glutamine-hydrolyzing) [Salinibacter sp.]